MTGVALFYSGKSLFSFPSPLPLSQSNVGIVGIPTAALYWGWGGEEGQKRHMMAKVQSMSRLLPTRIVDNCEIVK